MPDAMDCVPTVHEKLAAAEASVRWWKEHAEELDKNWGTLHGFAMTSIREALGLPEGTVPQLVWKIEGIKERLGAIATDLGIALGPKLDGQAPVSAREWREIADRAYKLAKGG